MAKSTPLPALPSMEAAGAFHLVLLPESLWKEIQVKAEQRGMSPQQYLAWCVQAQR